MVEYLFSHSMRYFVSSDTLPEAVPGRPRARAGSVSERLPEENDYTVRAVGCGQVMSEDTFCCFCLTLRQAALLSSSCSLARD